MNNHKVEHLKNLKNSLDYLMKHLEDIDDEFDTLYALGYEGLITANSDFSEGIRWIISAFDDVKSELYKARVQESKPECVECRIARLERSVEESANIIDEVKKGLRHVAIDIKYVNDRNKL